MYCSKCGKNSLDYSNFCSGCGSPLNVNDVENEVLNDFTDEHALSSYVGKKADVYFRKWGIESGPIRTMSFNIPAFFLGYIWAAYRKMYGVLFALLFVWLVFDAYTYSQGDDSGIAKAIGFGTSFLLGWFGNYLYYLQAKRKIDKIKKLNPSNIKEKIEKAGGASILSVFYGFIFFILYLAITSIIVYPLFSKESPIEFGYDVVDGTVTNLSDHFKPLEEIYFEFQFPDSKGGEIKVEIVKSEGSTEVLYTEWDGDVSLDWKGVYSSMEAPEEEGTYIMKIIKNDEIIAKGTFYVNK